MLIDDSSTNNILYENILSDEGYKVIVCESAKEALKNLQKEIPNLIILDLMMPGMDGFDFIQKKNEMESARDIPIIMLTANISGDMEYKAKKMGVAFFLNKPLGISEIIEKVEQALKLA